MPFLFQLDGLFKKDGTRRLVYADPCSATTAITKAAALQLSLCLKKLAWRRKEIEQRVWQDLRGCSKCSAVIGLSLGQVSGRRSFIYTDQIVLLRRQRYRVLLQKCLLRVQLSFRIAIDGLLLSNKVESRVNRTCGSPDGSGVATVKRGD